MIRYFQNTREITYMLIYLMALDTEEERIKFVRLYEDYRNRMHYTASILLKSEIEAEEFLNTLIKGLKYPYREVIYLQYHNKLNSRQIAELLRTSPANVRKISSRAREQLKKGMQKKGYTCEYGF